MTDLTSKAAEIRAGLVERLRRAVMIGEDGCGTLPAKEAVKVRPADWHRITRLAREAAALIEQQAAELAAKASIYDEQVTRAEKQWQAWEARATTAESERAEHLAAIARLEGELRLGGGIRECPAPAWQPIETAPKDGTLVDLWHDEFGRHADCYWGFPEHCCGEAGSYCDSEWHSLEAGWVDGTLNASLDASDFTHWHAHPAPPSALENGPAGLADAHTKSPESTIATQSERIAALEAALKELLSIYRPGGKRTPARAIYDRARALTEGGAEHG